MSASKKDTARDIAKAKNVLKKYHDEIKKISPSRKPGIGFKFENGKMTDKVALIFHVEKKKNKDDILSEGGIPIPKEIGGTLTDVVELPGGFKPRKNIQSKILL
ncbi:MAG TPA: hypothetical protein VKA91_02995 [Nitrososphaeraceae archaeon]|nr:hypothetical protein [Nitrososphaeraceae archaeon]